MKNESQLRKVESRYYQMLRNAIQRFDTFQLPSLRDRTLAYVLLLPSAVLLSGLVFIPVAQAITYSFTDKNTILPEYKFVGLDNYFSLLNQPDFPISLRNSVIWTAGAVSLEMAVGLIVSIVLQQKFRFRSIARVLVLFPYLLPTIVSALVWRFMLHDLLGIVNYALIAVNMIREPILWFSEAKMAMVSVILIGTWKNFPFVVIALLGIMQSIPSELYEAARSDGANPLQEFWHITLPAIMPVFLLTALLRTIWTWDGFDLIFLLTGGGPAMATTTLPVFVYRQAFGNWDMGRAAAVAMVTFVILLLLILVYLRAYESAERNQR